MSNKMETCVVNMKSKFVVMNEQKKRNNKIYYNQSVPHK